MKRLFAVLFASVALFGTTAAVANAGPSDGAQIQGWTWDDR